ncbi:MAG: aminotransferase class III-fold pyridoxal phosphate-dependent enzyme, partial [Deltaproteobacteria bacterium]|nr:aminotransferase class III-fold pyridoxal phosphate-dependent enzyme [Deltaproteobacteria bacterium]
MNRKARKSDPISIKKSEELWAKTIKYIPSGTQTFSKAPFQHVNGVSPKYLTRGKGPRVWDLDGNEYIDFMFGLGPAILGHADDEVNRAIHGALKDGIAMSLPHPLETDLAELLVELIPCAEMVRFGKNGSDATSGAIRVARAYTGRDKIACCGYHGWQDWYIGSTWRNLGVPQAIQNLTLKFEYNKIDSLKKLLDTNKGEIAAVIMEPVNFYEPEDDFLNKVKELVQENGALFIFDEIITGFRMAMGGAQEYYGVVPDLSCFGKAMANGMPVSAVVGKTDIMALFDEIFFSLTFGGEVASIAASLATIRALQHRNGIEHIWNMGRRLMDGYASIVKDLDMQGMTKMIGFPFWPEYVFTDKEGNPSREIQSLFQQEIVRRGILTRAGMMLSVSHTEKEIDETLNVFSEALPVIKEAVTLDNVLNWLDGDVIEPV